jgi:hypothetical protein
MADNILTKVLDETKVIVSVEDDYLAVKNVHNAQVELVTESDPLYVSIQDQYIRYDANFVYTQNSASCFVTLSSAPSTAYVDRAACGYNAGNSQMRISTGARPQLNSGAISPTFNMSFTTPNCFRAFTRSNSTQMSYWIENVGTLVSANSTSITSGNWAVGNRSNSAGPVSTNYDGYISTFGVGGNLTQSDINILVSALNTYNNTIN